MSIMMRKNLIGCYVSGRSCLLILSFQLITLLLMIPATAWCQTQEVLVYFANEPTKDELEEQNLRQLMRWLIDQKKPLPRRLAELLAEDRQLFPQAVERDLLQLHTRLREDPHWRALGVVVLTNQLAREGRILLHMPGEDGLRPEVITLPVANDVILAAQPLSDGNVMRLALQWISQRFASPQYKFALVLKTHATPTLAVAPFAGLNMAKIATEDLLVRLPQNDKIAPAFADIGIQKQNFLSLLDASGLNFSLVFLDAVYGAPQFERLVQTSSSVKSKYATIPYAALVPGPQSGGLIGVLQRSINNQTLTEQQGLLHTKSSAMRYLLLLPLVLGFALIVWLMRRPK